MARANWRAVSASTLAMAGPSRRCTWKSSGRRSVRRSIGLRILLCSLQRPFIELAFRLAGDARRELRCLARRQAAKQHVQYALGIDRGRGSLFARCEHQHELALPALASLVEPGQGCTERHPCDLLELLAQLPGDDDLTLRAEALRQVFERVAHAMRCLV